jgi:hypothetical protein
MEPLLVGDTLIALEVVPIPMKARAVLGRNKTSAPIPATGPPVRLNAFSVVGPQAFRP